MPTLFITSPLEAEQAERLAGLDKRLTVVYAPDLLPVPGFPGDHGGLPLTRTPEQQARWRRHLAEADILWGVPTPEDAAHAGKLRWIQHTSTGAGPVAARMNRPGRDRHHRARHPRPPAGRVRVHGPAGAFPRAWTSSGRTSATIAGAGVA